MSSLNPLQHLPAARGGAAPSRYGNPVPPPACFSRLAARAADGDSAFVEAGHFNRRVARSAARIVMILSLTLAAAPSRSPGAAADLDLSYDPLPGADAKIADIAMQPDGKAVIVGSFSKYQGVNRRYLARVRPDATLDAAFNPGNGADGEIVAVALQSDGRMAIGGRFQGYNNVGRNRVARLNADGTLDTTFAPAGGADGEVSDLEIQSDGRIVIVGSFSAVNGVARSRVARLNGDGSLDTSFNPGTGPNGAVYGLALQADGRILIGGQFWRVGTNSINRIARLKADGSFDDTFSSPLPDNGYIEDIRVNATDGSIYLGGGTRRFMKLSAAGAVLFDNNFRFDSDVLALRLQPDGKVLAGGFFTSFSGASRPHLARFNSDGTLDPAFAPGAGANTTVRDFALQPDGRILVVGDFTSYQGTNRGRILRLENDQRLPPAFTLAQAEVSVPEDAGQRSFSNFVTNLTPGSPAATNQTVTFTVTNSNPALFSSPPAIDVSGTLTFAPAAHASGSAVLSVTGTDDGTPVLSFTTNFTITVTPVNDKPAFDLVTNAVFVLEDSGTHSLSALATGVVRGPADESDQSVAFHVSHDNGALFSAPPALGTNGTLTFTPAANANGVATVTVYLTDNGGTAEGGDDTSTTNSFTITVNPVNDPPAISFATNTLVVLEDSGPQSHAEFATFGTGPANESGQSITNVVTSNNNPALFLIPPALAPGGTLTFAPAADAAGSATVTVVIQDNGGTADGGVDRITNTFTLTVTAVNDAPGFTKGADQTVLEDAGPQNIPGWATALSAGPADESGQTVNFLVANDNPALFSAPPAVAATGALTFTTATNASGAATVSVQIRDNGGTAGNGADTSAAQTFTITVTPVNDAPTVAFASANVFALATGGVFTSNAFVVLGPGPADEGGQAAGIVGVSHSDAELFTVAPAMDAAGNLTFTPAGGAGSSVVTVIAQDDGGTANGGVNRATNSFTIVIGGLNQAPTFAVAATPVTVREEAGAQTVANYVTGISPGAAEETNQTVSFFTTTDHPEFFASGPAVDGGGTLSFTPATNAFGTATVSLWARDNGGTLGGGGDTSATNTFPILITPVNDAPVATLTTNLVVLSAAAGGLTNAGFAGFQTGPANESAQRITNVVVVAGNPALFQSGPVLAPDGTLRFTLVAGAFGSSTVSVTLQDDGGTADDGVAVSDPVSFTIQISGINDPPRLALNQSLLTWPAGARSGAVHAWGSNADGQLGNGGNESSPRPVAVTNLADVAQAGASFRHSVARTAAGEVWSWGGGNVFGTLGNGGTASTNAPGRVLLLTNVAGVTVPANDSYALAVTAEGTAWSWGRNSQGQLGLTGLSSTNRPAIIPGLSNLVAVAAGGGHALALTGAGLVWSWGLNSDEQLGRATSSGTTNPPAVVPGLTNITALAAGDRHSLALAADGRVFAWGDNSSGQIGTGVPGGSVNQPAPVAGLSNLVAVAAGGVHSLALDADGRVFAWGDNDVGQLGVGGFADAASPTLVAGLANVTAIAGGWLHSLALRADGTVFSWGLNLQGQLGTGVAGDTNDVPVQVTGLADVIAIAAGSSHSLAVVAGTGDPASPPKLLVWEDGGSHSLTGFASVVLTPADETSQTVTFHITTDNLALFSSAPALDANGTLSFAVTPDVTGLARISVYATDNGGTADGGWDTSRTNVFVIRVREPVTRLFVNAQPKVLPGGTVEVPVSLAGTGNVNGVSFSLTFDPGRLTYLDARLGTGAASAGAFFFTAAGQAAQGRVGIAQTLPGGSTYAAGTNELAVFTFTAGASAAPAGVAIGFGDQPLVREVSDALARTLAPVDYDGGEVRIGASTWEGDVAPRPDGNGTVGVSDAVQVGRFVAGMDVVNTGAEFQRADVAPRATLGDGQITVADWVQALRYATGLDPLTDAGGPAGTPASMAPAGSRAVRVVASSSRRVRLVAERLTPGLTNRLAIWLDGLGDEAGLSLSLGFDAALLNYLGATVADGVPGAMMLVNDTKAASGRLGLALVLPPGQALAAGSHELARLDFRVPAGRADAATVLNQTDTPVVREVTDTRANTLAAGFPDATLPIVLPEEFRLLPPTRPAGGGVLLSFGNHDGSPVTAERLAGLEVFATSDAGLRTWERLDNALRLVNGRVELVDSRAGERLRFYQIKRTAPVSGGNTQ